jgi:two-component system sensor histidine kinase/response regulator
VDDNPATLDIMAAMARSLGWQVDTASSGPLAIELVEQRARSAKPAYQAIFVDWLMPGGMDGWETLSRIEEIRPQPDAPILVMVTTQGREMLSQRTPQEQARLHGFLVKPVTAPMLLDAVSDAMAGRRQLRATPRVKAPTPRRLEGLRLLVVDDNLINQQVAQELLSGEGAHIELAENGQLGVDAVRDARPPFDAVLMDIQMPVMDGYTATRAIRHDLGLPELPVIAMTANAMASDRDACLTAGMNDHVGKPFDLAHLIRVVLQHVDHARAVVPPTAIGNVDTANNALLAQHPSGIPATAVGTLDFTAGVVQCDTLIQKFGAPN